MGGRGCASTGDIARHWQGRPRWASPGEHQELGRTPCCQKLPGSGWRGIHSSPQHLPNADHLRDCALGERPRSAWAAAREKGTKAPWFRAAVGGKALGQSVGGAGHAAALLRGSHCPPVGPAPLRVPCRQPREDGNSIPMSSLPNTCTHEMCVHTHAPQSQDTSICIQKVPSHIVSMRRSGR